MAADLGGSQISALLESVPGIRNVLRSPVADALVNMIRAATGLRPFAFPDAEELIQYAVRRGLINESEGEQVLEEVKAAGAASARAAKEAAAAKGARKHATGGKKKAAAHPKPTVKRSAPRKPVAHKPADRRPVKKR